MLSLIDTQAWSTLMLRLIFSYGQTFALSKEVVINSLDIGATNTSSNPFSRHNAQGWIPFDFREGMQESACLALHHQGRRSIGRPQTLQAARLEHILLVKPFG